jgi:tripartite-type tricarboxylate transporter receptor subunit TctC
MVFSRFADVSVFACALFALAERCSAADYPVRPIRLIVASAPGGGPDISARTVAGQLAKQLGQQIVVDNRAGASGIIGYDLIAKASPDGYTIGYSSSIMVTTPSLISKLPFDPLRDFQPLIMQTIAVNAIAVSPGLPVTSVQGLIDHARANPGKLLFGSSGTGGSQHLSMELFKSMTGTRLVHVPYKAIQQALADTISGQVHIVCENMSSIRPHILAGRIRGLGVTSLKRTPVLPDLPTISEAGVPGYESTPWGGYILPARSPRDIVTRLNTELNTVLTTSAVAERFASFGSVVIGGTPEYFADYIQRDFAKWAKVIRDAGIKLE